MSDPASAVLAVLLAFPVYSGDRGDSKEARAALLRPVAEAIAAVGRTPEEQAVLVTLAHEESGLARYVLEGRCQDGPPGARCDGGLARGPWQVWAWCRELGNRGEASCALRMYRFGGRLCADRVEGSLATASFAGYSATNCRYALAPKRAEVLASVLGKLLKLRG